MVRFRGLPAFCAAFALVSFVLGATRMSHAGAANPVADGSGEAGASTLEVSADGLPGLWWHAEFPGGETVVSRHADRGINPASVVKIATSSWALARLGPSHRFETRIVAEGDLDLESGVLDGHLVVVGGGDPDFQPENAFAVALRLNEIGVREVRGDVAVRAPFWIGWEGGSEKRLEDEADRTRLMGRRFRSAIDPRRWDRKLQRAWRRFAARRGIDPDATPRVRITGGSRIARDGEGGRVLAIHRSKPLADVLRRFNAWSNNDIERLESGLGPPSALAAFMREHVAPTEPRISLASTSGLGVNRMTLRQVVDLVRFSVSTAERHGLEPSMLLPMAGCGPGTLSQFYLRLSEPPYAGSVVGKTGSLIYTDHGVSILAGIASTARGPVYFAAAMPRAGRKLHWARRLQESFVLRLIDAAGGAAPLACDPSMPMPDEGAAVLLGRGRPEAPATLRVKP